MKIKFKFSTLVTFINKQSSKSIYARSINAYSKVTDSHVGSMLLIFTFIWHASRNDNRSLWLDELARLQIALNGNVLDDYLLHPNASTVATPVLLVILTKITFAIFGTSDIALKIMMQTIGALVPFFLYKNLRLMRINQVSSISSSLYIAISSGLIDWSLEYKNYVVESVQSLVFIYVFIQFVKNPTKTQLRKLYIFGAVLAAASYLNIALFVASAVTSFIFDRRNIKFTSHIKYFSVSMIWFVLLYAFQLRFAATNTDLHNFWKDYFPNNGLFSLDFYISKLAEMLNSNFRDLILFNSSFKNIIWIFLLLALMNNVGVNHQAHKISIFMIIYILIVVFSNFIGVWPIGDIRMNYSIALNLFVILCLIINISKVRIMRIFASLLLVSLFIISFTNFAHKTSAKDFGPAKEDSRTVLLTLSRQIPTFSTKCQEVKYHIFANIDMKYSFEYYGNFDKNTTRALSNLFDKDCVNIEYLDNNLSRAFNYILKSHSTSLVNVNSYIVYTHMSETEATMLFNTVKQNLKTKYLLKFDGSGIIHL